jgi:hypothetical protein
MKISKKRQYQIDLNKELTKLVYQETYMDNLSQDELCILNQLKQSIPNVSGVVEKEGSF